MQSNKYRVSGAFFEKGHPNGPAFSGFVEIDGVKTHIALWPETSKSGMNYLSVREDKRKNQAQGAAPQGGPAPRSPFGQRQAPRPQGGPVRPSANPNDDMDDEIPFNKEWR